MSVSASSVRLAAAAVLTGAALAGCTSAHPVAARRPSPGRRHAVAGAHVSARSTPSPTPTVAPDFRGTLITRTIPGTRSGFRGRPAYIYVPAAVRTAKATNLPVLELLHGTPGGPDQWTRLGHAHATADAFEAAHHGLAPIIVMPDINGTLRGDTECVHAAHGDIEKYLTVDVPDFVLAHFPATHNRKRWSIAGASEGATCALMLALRHTASFRLFGDLSGLGRPTVGEHDNRRQTIDILFNGSAHRYDEHDPLWLLAHHTYPQLVGWLACGHDEGDVGAAQAVVARAAHRAGLPVTVRVLPGAHNWTVWSTAFRDLLAWIWSRTSH